MPAGGHFNAAVEVWNHFGITFDARKQIDY
jgi:hypothetical protein